MDVSLMCAAQPTSMYSIWINVICMAVGVDERGCSNFHIILQIICYQHWWDNNVDLPQISIKYTYSYRAGYSVRRTDSNTSGENYEPEKISMSLGFGPFHLLNHIEPFSHITHRRIQIYYNKFLSAYPLIRHSSDISIIQIH